MVIVIHQIYDSAMLLILLDMLDEFSATKLDAKPDAPTASGPGRPDPSASGKALEETPDDFNKQLKEQMASLLGEIDESPEMRQQMEAMMKELSAGADTFLKEDDAKLTSKPVAGSIAGGSSLAPEEAFQETIRTTYLSYQAQNQCC